MCLQQLLNRQNWVQSPLNYTGGKYKLLPQLFDIFPENISTFVDLFCGGANVGVNVLSQKIILNDIDADVIGIIKMLHEMAIDEVIKGIEDIIRQYNLSNSFKNGYEYYNTNSMQGLAQYNRNSFNELKTTFNRLSKKDNNYYLLLFTIIIFSFNNQIRFNSKHEFNLPVGKRDFNASMRSKVYRFCKMLKNKNLFFSQTDFRLLDLQNLDNESFVYVDPPYLVTCASYNENGGWNIGHEQALYEFLDNLCDRDIKFALSNVAYHGDKINTILLDWIDKNPRLVVHNLNYQYSNSNYHKKNRDKKSNEILVTNY